MSSMPQISLPVGHLSILDRSKSHTFVKPTKRIHEGHDVAHFLTSKSYGDIGIFVMQLNMAMCPSKTPGLDRVEIWQLDSNAIIQSEPVRELQELLQKIDAFIDEVPPDPGPRRFGNVSFRKWYEILESRVQDLLHTYLPSEVIAFGATDEVSVLDELTPYLLGAFGSSQRLDYGTGHELSFLAFLGCIWKLGGFTNDLVQGRSLERSIVVNIIEPYLRVVRRLILTYTLEPAGSHGVWGLDDHSFLPYIFGSSQYCPAITEADAMPVEGFLPGSPNPGDIAKKDVVDQERQHNMYFSAVGFINDVKTGPFWEHSPILFDISGVRSGWGKINKGMIKMYNAEVLSKFPVVQHFPFGSLFSWDQDPNATAAMTTAHSSSQPNSSGASRAPQETTRAPWANTATNVTAAPWAATSRPPPPGQASTTRSNPSTLRSPGRSIPPPDGPTKAPWAK